MLTRTYSATTVLIGILVPAVASAQPADTSGPEDGAPGFRPETLTTTDAGGTEHDYAYSVWRSPALADDAAAPAILFLHGYGECGVDGEKQLRVGLPPQLEAHPERWPFVVIIPQKPVANSEWEDHGNALTEITGLEFENENVDPERVAITGLSQGGHGTIAMAARHPDRFSAVAPVCGYVVRWNNAGEKTRGATSPDSAFLAQAAEALAEHPVWIFHGGRDDVVQPREAHLLHDTLDEAGSTTVKLTVFPDDNHNSWDSSYGDSGLAEWMIEHTAATED